MRNLTMFLICLVLFVGTALAQPTGAWTLYPPQATVNSVQVQQPINADGSSVFKAGKGVIPVKFTLATGVGPVTFSSLQATGSYSYLSFHPSPSVTFSQITSLIATYSFTTGNCYGGSLRWSVSTSKGNLFIYYGAPGSFTDCSGTNSQSGVNILSLSDGRFDTAQIPGGKWGDTYAGALSLIGSEVVNVALVLDGGWGGDQVVGLTGASVNGNIWTPTAVATPTPTCALPPATIQITKTGEAAPLPVDEVASIQANDTNGQFRVSACQYVYNLANTLVAGEYKAEVLIGGTPATGNAIFSVK